MSHNALINKLKTLMAFRVFFVTVILGSFLFFHIGYETLPYSSGVQYLIVFLYSLTFIYIFLLDKLKAVRFAYLQLCIDVSSAVALIIFTGGIESWFTLVLLLIVLEAAIVVDKKAGYMTAALGGALYGLVLYMQHNGSLPIPFEQTLLQKDFAYKGFSIISAMIFTAYLTGQLTSRLERKDIDLEELSLFNKEVIESTPSGLFTTDLNGSIQLFNRAAENITGIERAEAYGKNVALIFPFIGSLVERKRMEEVVVFGDKKKVIGLSISAIQDSKGKNTGFIGIFQDLTELKKMADEIKQKEKLAAIGEMSANMAHEIRNPLASLKSSIEMLREDTIPVSQKQRLMTIAISEMDRLNTIITDFLNYSRPMSFESKSFDIHAVIGETVEMLKNRDSAANRIVFKKEFSGPMVIKGDPQKLQQVFWNLGLNALDAMPAGGDMIVNTEESNDSIMISFIDTGTGISKEDLNNVLYPFFTTKKNGTGLGLSIAYKIIEGHNGSMSITSKEGKGTKIDILLPKE